jgi:polar amino acid transport system substrate-binding protein
MTHLADKTADAVIAGLAISAESRATLDFSDIYMRLPGRFVVRRNEAGINVSPQGLRGHTLAVVTGTAHEAYLASMFPEIGRKLYPTAEAAREAVKSGAADAHFGDGLQLSFWLASGGAEDCCVFAGGPYLEARFFGQGYAIAFAKGATDLKHAVNAALQAIYEKGVYTELYLRYFPVGFF